MAENKGMIVLMGSGELTATMVEVHKELLSALGRSPQAVFLDTPAGFQLNADQLSQRAVAYFRDRVQRPLTVASYKSSEDAPSLETEKAFGQLRQADYVLIGPGSPTYAVRQWHSSPVPELLTRRIASGGCLVAASAAALTVGRFTLPVYEIYKVGQQLHWVEGLDILGHFGFSLVVIPHWNNAEGGTHDTRFCYMGESRFDQLESMLPEDVGICGLDEHTAFLIDLEKQEAEIRGIGQVILRRGGSEVAFTKGDRVSLGVLRGDVVGKRWSSAGQIPRVPTAAPDTTAVPFWDRVHALGERFTAGLENGDAKQATNALLELDHTIWQADRDSENEEFITQSRDLLRELIVHIGTRLEQSPQSAADCLAPLVTELLALRENYRQEGKWQDADQIRDTLFRAGVIVEDTPDGSRWRMK
jgi:peptidase E